MLNDSVKHYKTPGYSGSYYLKLVEMDLERSRLCIYTLNHSKSIFQEERDLDSSI